MPQKNLISTLGSWSLSGSLSTLAIFVFWDLCWKGVLRSHRGEGTMGSSIRGERSCENSLAPLSLPRQRQGDDDGSMRER